MKNDEEIYEEMYSDRSRSHKMKQKHKIRAYEKQRSKIFVETKR